MEEGKEGGFFSRLFKRKTSQETQQPQQTPQETQKQAIPSAYEDRQRRMLERNLQQQKATFQRTVGQAKGTAQAPEMKDTRAEAIKQQVEKIGATQTVEQARQTQEKFTPEGAAGERFSRLTSQPETPSPTSLVEPTEAKKNLTENEAPTLSEKRAKQIDPEALKKSLGTPTSEWGKEDIPKEELIEETKKMEGITPTPKEEITPETIKKIVNKLEQSPTPQAQTPHFEAKGGSEVLKRVLRAEEKLKRAA